MLEATTRASPFVKEQETYVFGHQTSLAGGLGEEA